MNIVLKTVSGRLLLILGLILCCFGSVSPVHAAPVDLFVSASGSGTDCIQSDPCLPGQAMENAVAGDTIYFMYGEYSYPETDPYLVVNKAVSLIGGWDGSPSGEITIEPFLWQTTFFGDSTNRLFEVDDTSGSLVTISGFVFFNGKSTLQGGAINVKNGRVDIIGNMFGNNSAGSFGGAIAVVSTNDVRILSNYFADNEAAYGGGNIYISNGSGNSLIEGNYFWSGTAEYGASIYNQECSTVINRNVFVENIGDSVIMISAITLSSIVSNNYFILPEYDSINVSDGAQNQIINNTIIGGRYGISINAGTPTFIANNIITEAIESIHNPSSTLTGSNNLFFNNTSDPEPLTDTVYEDPMFVDAESGDYHIRADSPAVDAGVSLSLDEDYEGDFRPMGSGFDIGADEVDSSFVYIFPLFYR